MRHTALPENRLVRGQPERGVELAEDLERICQTYGGENVAAVFVETRQPARAVVCPRPGLSGPTAPDLRSARILLVFDEVIRGWGRMGANFGAQAFGVTRI